VSGRDPADDLRSIAFCLERALEPSYRVRAFRTAAAVVDRTPSDELARRAADGTLVELSGIGKVTALVVTESLAGEEPVYLRRVQTLGATRCRRAPAAAAAAAGRLPHAQRLVRRRLADRGDGPRRRALGHA
jgi:putative hydrolase